MVSVSYLVLRSVVGTKGFLNSGLFTVFEKNIGNTKKRGGSEREAVQK